MRILGRFISIIGAVAVIYACFIPVMLMEFPVPAQNIGGIKIKLEMQVESSLYKLGDKLDDIENAKIPEILDYLWLIFVVLAGINLLLAMKKRFPYFLRLVIGILPLALLTVVVIQTASDPSLKLGYAGLFEALIGGFYILASGTLMVLIGALFTIPKPARRH